MKQALVLALPISIALTACTSTRTGNAMEDNPMKGEPEEMAQCDAAPAQTMIGMKADSGTGAKILALTGAEILRWGPPNTALTMDYRPNRVTVSYDDAMVIDRITCG